ncbi:MAG: T9SS type A sorting domain-containing protein [Candidatus Kapaibacterium sp.]
MKKLILLIITAIILSSIAYSKDCVDEENVYEFSYHGKKYEFIKQSKWWPHASECAENRGGYLTVIESQEENDAILNFLTNELPTKYGVQLVDNDFRTNHNIWIGGLDFIDTCTWMFRNSKDSIRDFYFGRFDYGKVLDGGYVNWGKKDGKQTFPIRIQDLCAISMSLEAYYDTTKKVTQTEPGQWINQRNQIFNYFIIEYDCFDTIRVESDFKICFGESIVFDGDTITEAGVYSDTVETYSYCDSIHTLTVYKNELDDEIRVDNKTIRCLETKADKYEWFSCDGLEGLGILISENRILYTPTKTGKYRVKLTKGQCEYISSCYEVCFPTTNKLDTVKCKNDAISINDVEYTKQGNFTQNLKQKGFDCDSTLEIDIRDVAINLSVKQQSGKLVSSESSGEYQWYNCEGDVLLADATQKEYTPIEDGDYKVEITKQGCIDYSQCISFSTSTNSVKDIQDSDNIRLDLDNNLIVFDNINYNQVELLDISSKTIYKSNKYTQSISIEYLNTGVYFLKVVIGNEVEMFKFIVVK